MTQQTQIRDFIANTLSKITGIAGQDLDADMNFDSYGLSSASAVIMLGELEEFVDMDLSPSVLFEHNTINKLAAHVQELVPL